MTACAGLFAGKPAPTESSQDAKIVLYLWATILLNFQKLARSLWERVYPRRGRTCMHGPRTFPRTLGQTFISPSSTA
ncbi:protein of unknown function [Pseudomonas sp. JV551A1]|nr:protein of unknown function [Pseudomonas sp. JV551A1]